MLDRKIGYEGRKEPETRVVPYKEADEEGNYQFDHWEEVYRAYDSVYYDPVFRKSYHAAEFQDIALAGTSVYPGDIIRFTGNLMDMETGSRINQKRFSISLMKNGNTVCSDTSMAYAPFEEYPYNIYDCFGIPEGTEPGTYTLRMYYSGDEGEAEYDSEITVLQQTNVNIAFTTPRQAAIGEKFDVEGTLTTDSGEPYANKPVLLGQSNSVGYRQIYTNGEGKFKTQTAITQEGMTTIYVRLFDNQYRAEEAKAPIYIYDGEHGVTVSQAENGTASADVTSAKCGDTVTLTAKPDKGYRLLEWEVVSGEISIDGDSFVMLTQDVEIKPVFEPNMHTVTIVLGDYGEDITVNVPYGERFFNELDKEGVFNTLFNMETDEYLFRDLATKPLREFADEEEFGEDAWELLDTRVVSDMTVYAGFYKKIKNVNLTLALPVAGTEVTVTENNDIYTQTPAPVITLDPDAHCAVSEGSAAWYAENYEGGMYEGTFETGKTYLADFILMPDFGYWLDDETEVTANGAEVVEATGRMSMLVTLSASPEGQYLLGDTNGDGRVNIRDVTAIQRHLAELELLNSVNLLAADINRDGEVNISDATHLQMFLAEYFDNSPIGTLIG